MMVNESKQLEKLRKSFSQEIISQFLGQEVLHKNPNSFDCATFVKFMYSNWLNINILNNGYGKSLTTRIMTSQIGHNFLIDESASIDEKLTFLKTKAKVGDIMFFHTQSLSANSPDENNYYPGHLGIYLGNGKYIDARWKRGDIKIVNFKDDNYSKTFVGIKNIISTYKNVSKTNNIE